MKKKSIKGTGKSPVYRLNARTATKAPARKTASRAKQKPDDNSALRELLVDSIKDIYWAEKHLLKAIPKMEKAATTDELKEALAEHLEVTRGHVERLDRVFELLDEKAQAKKCEAMEGLTKEAETVIEETDNGSLTRDAALIMAAQKVEHYEIATYGSLVHLSRTLGEEEVAALFEETLGEEKEADESLSQLADEKINAEALHESESEEEEEDEDEE